MANVFISYRRSDAEGWAGRLSDSLKAILGRIKIFRDIDDIPPGVEFDAYINDSVSSCNALIVLIGPHWLAVTDKIGKRRLDDPTDFVRLEIATALKRDIRVIPVLVGGAEVPNAADLPEDLKPLARRHAYCIADTHWAADCKQLAGVLKPLVRRPATGIGRKTIVSLGLILFLAIGGILMKTWRDRELELALESQLASAEKASAEKAAADKAAAEVKRKAAQKRAEQERRAAEEARAAGEEASARKRATEKPVGGEEQEEYGMVDPPKLARVQIRKGAASPGTVRPGGSVQIDTDYSLLMPTAIAAQGANVQESFSLKKDGKVLTTSAPKTFHRPAGGWVATKTLPIPQNAEPGTYVVETKVQVGSSYDSDEAIFVVEP